MTPPNARLLRRLLASLGAAALLVLTGCASAPQGPAHDSAALAASAAASGAVTPDATPAAAASAVAAAASAAAAGASTADDNEGGKDAAGQPTDAMQPDEGVSLGDARSQEDLWNRVRAGFAMPDIDTPYVHEHEQWYASRPDYVQRMNERAQMYLYHVVTEIERRKMPTEIALLPFIESAFNPRAVSGARATGMWQFIPSTGKNFDLTQNLFRDDRRDIVASTRAALDYLQRLHDMFGDWQLALAAYNWGEGNVQRAIAHNQRLGRPTDYLSLNMPAETAHYLPKLQAVKNIVMHPEQFGLALAPIPNHPYFVSVPLKRDIDVALAARLAKLDMDEFHALNPSLNKPVILAAGTPQVLLPYDNATTFIDGLNNYQGPLASWTAWVAPKTMKPAAVAERFGISESELRDMNKIPPRMLIKAGSTLVVPRSASKVADVSESLADNAHIILTPDRPALRRIFVRAGRRDTVAGVARRYHVSAEQVAQWNHVSEGAHLAHGRRLALYVPGAPRQHLAATHGRHAVVARSQTRPASHHRAVARAVTRHRHVAQAGHGSRGNRSVMVAEGH